MSERSVLVIDIGGNNVKLHRRGEETRKFRSGKWLTPEQFLQRVHEATSGWTYDRIALGYPGLIVNEQIADEPENLGHGWKGFDFAAAFEMPVRLINDAALQALGSYRGGRMLFLGFGTALGSTLIAGGVIIPLELGNLRFSKRATLVDVLGREALERDGTRKWRKSVAAAIEILRSAFAPDEIVLGGGNVDELDELPEGTRRGGNENALEGGLRLWADVAPPGAPSDRRFRIG